MARNRQRAKDRKQKLKRKNVPGQLDHASGDVEKAEAAIVAGAADAAEPVVGEPFEDEELEDSEEDDDEALDREQLQVGSGEVASEPSTKDRSGLRIVNFARACVAELQRVQWPDRRQTGQATAVVLGFVVIAGAFLGLADTVAKRIIEFLI